VILTLGPGERDWQFGDVLRLHTHDRIHEYTYMFVYRKSRAYMPNGEPNDRGFAAYNISVDCPYGSTLATNALLPCRFDHSRIGKVSASYGGLPREDSWELIS